MARLTPDICVIGGGAGGFALAEEAVRLGASVVLVDRQEPGGGPVRQAMPLHALLAAAAQAHAMRSTGLGVEATGVEIDFKAVRRHVRAVTAATGANRSAARLAAFGVEVLREGARFTDRRTLSAGEHEIRARHFVIATGSAPVAASFPGLDQIEPLAPETIAALRRKPARLIVVGDGHYGLAFAQAWRRLGCEVVALGASGALDGTDEEQAAVVLDALRAEGVDIRDHARLLRVEPRGKTGVRVILATDDHDTEQVVDGNALLFLPERTPAVDGLDLASGGIAFSPAGIEVDDTLRTSNRRVYAIGDVIGGTGGVHLAEHQARFVAQALLSGARGRTGPTAVPRVLFTSPQIAAIGLSAVEAGQKHGRIRVLRWPLAETDGARAAGRMRGFVTLIADERERILGVTIAADGAAELIAPWELAINAGLDVADMAACMPPYPASAEIGKLAAISYFSERSRKPETRRTLRFPRLLG